jgi:four helix bundle protein
MATVERFEDLEAWKRARELARAVYLATGAKKMDRDWDLRRQMRRAAVSVMANIAEGFARGGNREFVQFLSVARGSVAEVRSHLYLGTDLGYAPAAKARALHLLCERTGQVISGLMRYLRTSKRTGPKYRKPGK